MTVEIIIIIILLLRAKRQVYSFKNLALISVTGLFVPLTIRTTDFSYHVQTIRTMDHSSHRPFVPLTIRTIDYSYHGLFVPQTFRTTYFCCRCQLIHPLCGSHVAAVELYCKRNVKIISRYRRKPRLCSQLRYPNGSIQLRRVELNQISRQPDSTLLNARKSPEQISHTFRVLQRSHHEGIAGTEQDQTGPWPYSHPQ